MTDEREAALDVREIARILGISTDTVYRKVRTGELPGFDPVRGSGSRNRTLIAQAEIGAVGRNEKTPD